jgi:hypothetical protein
MEVGALTEKWVPGSLSQFFYAATQLLKAQQAKMGLVPFAMVAVFEFMSGAFLALNLLIYGASNTFSLPMTSGGMNFVETFLSILLSVPILGSIVGWMFGIGGTIGLYHVHHDALWTYLTATFISSIALGWVIRLFRMSRPSD